tara:strand:- start:217 stop:507 length:291 start_codon:yes stop_codon:yes gene_type:complete
MCVKKTGNYDSQEDLNKAVSDLAKTTIKSSLEISKIVGVSVDTVRGIIREERRVYNILKADTRNVKNTQLLKLLNILWPSTEVPVFDVELEEYVYE